MISITRKLINTNKNTIEIFSLVNFLKVLPMKIFPWYIPSELQWEKIKQCKKKKKKCVIFTNEITSGINSVGKIVDKL